MVSTPVYAADHGIHMASGTILDIHLYNPSRLCDSAVLYIHPHGAFTRARRLYGNTEDIVRVIKLNMDDLIVVTIATDLCIRINIGDVTVAKRLFVLYQMKHESLAGVRSWDIIYVYHFLVYVSHTLLCIFILFFFLS